ncbi:calmodulin-lysine N-methyltransferase-like isoform X2 [Antedon mediterranea]|uniref:calmodulin-lysine N-methyltransferase-like isoform X2 n=1 Tax=Antedon mediterranea TaxID=105859 RepID=UPI003AF66CBE
MAILKKTKDGEKHKKTSMIEFVSFNLLTTDQVLDNNGDVWHQYQYSSIPSFRARIKHISKSFNPEELIGFNNTGNVCVWPAEEVLTYWCLENRELFREKKICELGGGMTCLAGLTIGTSCEAEVVTLTDGNEDSVQNVKEILKENDKHLKASQVDASVLRWDKPEEYNNFMEMFDFVISADCLFFDQYREDLVKTINTILKPKGICIIFAPKRHNTCEEFCAIAKRKFEVTIDERYDAVVWDKHIKALENSSEIYDENRHYPLKITLTKT